MLIRCGKASADGGRSIDPVPYTRASVTELEVAYATEAVRHGWGARCYECLDRFEIALAERLGVAHAVATSSCTGAIHLGLAALDLPAGGEVILADTNWIATVSPIHHLGLKPVFVDIDPDSWCLSPEAVRAAVTPQTCAVVATHLYGNLCDLDALQEICDANGLVLIEDAAEALGSQRDGRLAGSYGRFGAFSFHGTKLITTGEGGALVTDDSELAAKVRMLNNHGRAPGDPQFWASSIGYKFRMSNIEAAIGLGQLERFDELLEKKRAIFAAYRARLAGFPGVRLNPEPTGCVNSYWMPTLFLGAPQTATAESALAHLREHGIDARVVFWPLSSLPMFGSGPGLPNARDFSQRAFNLPSFSDMSEDEILQVCDALSDILTS